MAAEPPAKLLQPPDISQAAKEDTTNKNQQQSIYNSNPSFMNNQNSEATIVEISIKELEWIQQINYLSQAGLLRVIPPIGKDSPSSPLPTNKISTNIDLQIANSTQAMLGRIETDSPHTFDMIRDRFSGIRGELDNGIYSPCKEAPVGGISANSNSQSASEDISGGDAGDPVAQIDQSKCQNVLPEMELHPNSKSSLEYTLDESNLVSTKGTVKEKSAGKGMHKN